MRSLVVAVLAFLPGLAHAEGWADFAEAFPAFPCSDGWMACVVDGDAVDPDLQRDGSGMPVPADLRLAFFDLEATAAFSPFGALSPYAAPPVEVAAAEPPPEVHVSPPAPSGTYPLGAGDPVLRQADKSPTSPDLRQADQSPTPSLRQADQSPTPADPEPPIAVLHQPDKSPTPPEIPPDPPPEAAMKVVPKDDATLCGNHTALEPRAMLGRLAPDEIGCLERKYAVADKQTDKDKLSRMLMGNAYSAGDLPTWERLVRRHLEEVDRSDPDISYKYAYHLAKKGVGSADAAIRWADVALERRHVWSGETYKRRVSSLYEIRAAAAQELWKRDEEKYAASPDDAARKAAEASRNRTKVLAREWYEYTVAAGRDPTTALQLCISAAGTVDYCKGS